MAFEKLKFKKISNKHMLENSYAFFYSIIRRRTVREFSDEEVPIEIIYNAIKSASSAPSGANKQPWHFVIVKDLGTKKDIRKAAEKAHNSNIEFDQIAACVSKISNSWIAHMAQFFTLARFTASNY